MRRGSRSTSSRTASVPGRYRTLAPNSQVEEHLFGNPDPAAAWGSCGAREKRGTARNRGAETIQIITKDLIRTLRLPSLDPSGPSLVLPRAQFDRMTSAPGVLTREEREARQKDHQRKKEEKLKASEERKNAILDVDERRRQQPVLTELELEARRRARRLVERADALRVEQEEEIRQLQQVILGAQCQAVRDLQIQEKRRSQEELAAEERRLDAMMEEERRRAVDSRDQVDELRRQQRIRGMQRVAEQIQQHQLDKQVQDEMKDQERQQFRDKLEQMNLEDLRGLEKKREEQRLLQEEIRRINAETVLAKEQRKEQERLADLRDMEYLQNKMQREAEYEAEQRRTRKEKDLEIAGLRAQQERARDYKAEQDELRARRNQEAMEREWRRTERERASRKAQQEATLRAARLDQVRNKEQCLSTEAGRDRAQFLRVLRAQQDGALQEKQQQERRRHDARHNAQAIRAQMEERQRAAEAQRRLFFTEADRLREEARLRQRRLHDVKQKKLKELMATGLSDKYCRQVQRKSGVCLA